MSKQLSEKEREGGRRGGKKEKGGEGRERLVYQFLY